MRSRLFSLAEMGRKQKREDVGTKKGGHDGLFAVELKVTGIFNFIIVLLESVPELVTCSSRVQPYSWARSGITDCSRWEWCKESSAIILAL